MSLSSNLSASFESYVETVMQTYDAVGIAVAVVDREGRYGNGFSVTETRR